MSGLPGVGVFGSDPTSKVLIQLLRHFEFDVQAVWTNQFDLATQSSDDAYSSLDLPKLTTTSIDTVLLNKNGWLKLIGLTFCCQNVQKILLFFLINIVNLIFICCQPNLHSQISTKALGKHFFVKFN